MKIKNSPFSKGSAALAAGDLILLLEMLSLNLSSDFETKVSKSPSLFTKERKKHKFFPLPIRGERRRAKRAGEGGVKKLKIKSEISL
ncbi:MAG: hypothetical protein LBG46_06505 [Elusimicrobiota bacterium]|nr:hypothetical protein [Elusimicrobiota bacterium]